MGIIETIKMLEYEEGIEIGTKIGAIMFDYKVVINLLGANQFTNAKISNFTGVTEAFVEKIKKDLNLENN